PIRDVLGDVLAVARHAHVPDAAFGRVPAQTGDRGRGSVSIDRLHAQLGVPVSVGDELRVADVDLQLGRRAAGDMNLLGGADRAQRGADRDPFAPVVLRGRL